MNKEEYNFYYSLLGKQFYDLPEMLLKKNQCSIDKLSSVWPTALKWNTGNVGLLNKFKELIS